MTNVAPPPFNTLGFKLQLFVNFVNECGGEDAFMKKPFVKEPLTCWDVCHKFVKPATSGSQLSYVEQLQEYENSPHVGDAQVYVCHCWSDIFIDTVKALQHQFKDDEDKIIWFDLFCNNQHVAPERSLPIKYHEAFLKQFKKFGTVLLVLSPWEDPTPLKRAWVLYELYCALVSEKRMEIAIPPAVYVPDMETNQNQNYEDFLAFIIEDPLVYFSTLQQSIKIENADTFKKEDRQKLVEDILKPNVGITKCNTMITQLMKKWVLSCVQSRIVADSKKASSGKIGLLSLLPLRDKLWRMRLSKACMLREIKDEKGKYRFGESLEELEKCEKEYEDMKDNKSLWAATYVQLARSLTEVRRYDEALDNYEKTLQIQLEIHDNDDYHPSVGPIYEEIARVYTYQEQWNKALDHLEKTLVILSKRLGGEDFPEITEAYNTIGAIHTAMSNYGEAMKYYGRALKLGIKRLDDDYPSVAGSYIGIAKVYMDGNECGQALKFIEKALDVQLDTVGEEHPQVGATYHIKATAFYGQANYDEALEFYMKAMRIRSRAFGDEDETVCESCAGIALTYHSQGICVKALEYYELVLKIQTLLYDEYDARIAETHNRMAGMYYTMEQPKNTLEHFHEALKIQRKCSPKGKESSHVGNTLFNIAMVYYQSGDHKTSLEWHEKAVPVKIASLGKEHVSVANSWYNMGSCCFALGKMDKAMEHYKKALSMRQSLFEPSHPEIAISYHAIALVYDKQAEYTKAMEFFEKAREIQHGKDVPEQTPREQELEVQPIKKVTKKKPLIKILPKKEED